MQAAESKIRDLLRSRINESRASGLIKCDAGEGVAGFSGSIETGWFRRTQDVTTLVGYRPDENVSFSDLLLELREASREEPQGPWYRCDIEIGHGNKIRFRYYWENAPFTSVKDLEPDLHGGVPHFVFERRFDRALVAELSDFDLNSSQLFYVPARLQAGKPVSTPLLDVFATLEWQSDVNNGAMNQYFARDHEPMTGLPRAELYAPTHRGLVSIGLPNVAAMYADSIALFAHFYDRVEKARQEMGIPAVPRQEESDIMKRFYDIESSLDRARVRYIREHIVELEQLPG
jgi:hypothetical protein